MCREYQSLTPNFEIVLALKTEYLISLRESAVSQAVTIWTLYRSNTVQFCGNLGRVGWRDGFDKAGATLTPVGTPL